jgi:tetratricopeptide (TPR) repeat protein
MGVLGSVEMIGSDNAFASEAPRPALPGNERAFTEKAPHVVRARSQKDASWPNALARLEETVRELQSRVDSRRSSTTLAALAQALEAADEHDRAIAIANEALESCTREAVDQLLDPISARISLEVLIRLGRLDDAVRHAERLPVGAHSWLMLGATLASAGRFAEARAFIDKADSVDREPVLAFLYLSEGNDRAAIPLLRAALRRFPDDADSLHNLSIAQWRLGSTRQAVAAALRATRAAPSREDIAIHYLELVLACGDFERVLREVESLRSDGVVASARLLVIEARARLVLHDFRKAEQLLERAGDVAREGDDVAVVAEVGSNLVRLRALHNKISRDEAVDRLVKMLDEFPDHDVVVANLAQVTYRKRHAAKLRSAFDSIRDTTFSARREFIEYQIATLEGDNASAAEHALAWVELEPANPHAVSAALVALGIGEERWQEAAKIASGVIARGPRDSIELNNAAYILAMAGRPHEAIKILQAEVSEDFVLRATLGLAYLANHQIDEGMKLYRQAAREAEKEDSDLCSLMTAYQALVVRQLGILSSEDASMISALSLPPVSLPDDWKDQPEFLRLYSVAERNHFGWPLAID